MGPIGSRLLTLDLRVMFKGPLSGGRGVPWGPYGFKGDVCGIQLGHRVDLMSPLMILKAYNDICLYPDFQRGLTGGWAWG